MRERPLLTYIVFAYVWTWVMALPLLLANRGYIPHFLPDEWEAVAAFGPFAAAVFVLSQRTSAERAEFWASMKRFDVGAGWLAFGLLTPFAFLAGAIAIAAVRGGSMPDFSAIGDGKLATMRGVVDLFLVSSILQGLGEEPGWRGYMLPRLRARFGAFASTVFIFPVWLFWHLPLFLSRPDFGLAQFAGFSMGILSAAFWMTLLWDHTRSAGLAVAWHALLNITRGLAMQISMAVFLGYGAVVSVGAIVIAIWWGVRRPKALGEEAFTGVQTFPRSVGTLGPSVRS